MSKTKGQTQDVPVEPARPGGLPDFSDLPRNPQTHFRLCWHGALLRVVQLVRQSLGSPDEVLRQAPFLSEYLATVGERGVLWTEAGALSVWWQAVERWEEDVSEHLPLRALRLARGNGWDVVGAWLTTGLVEDDPRFGELFARWQGGARRVPTVGFLQTCWAAGGSGPLRTLQEWGLVQVHAGEDSRHAWKAQVTAWSWDFLTGGAGGEGRRTGPGWSWEPALDRVAADEQVFPDEVQQVMGSLPSFVEKGAVDCVVVRGPRASGRTHVLRVLAARLGKGLLAFAPGLKAEDERWAQVGPLAILLGALPVVELDLAPGETVSVPEGLEGAGPLLVTLGRWGGVSGPGARRAVTLELTVPVWTERRALWAKLWPGEEKDGADELATRFRMPVGRLVALSQQAGARATLAGRAVPSHEDWTNAARSMQSEAMGSLASPLPEGCSWEELALPADVLGELRAVEARCRYREQLAMMDQRFVPNVGVRVLFSGPSGTGKTLAVRAIATALGRSVYRVDLAAVVNKYLGETEKNLERVLALAEELDLVLLIDEGDALLARRTAVQSSNDRYANLETNYLLQRLESYEGIVFITTNAGDRVDPAFHRRLDAVVEFRAPEMAERRRLWELHLPRASRVDPRLLDQIAGQCALTGGQVRNAALHARLLALEDGGVVHDELLVNAVRREYRKSGAACPLRWR